MAAEAERRQANPKAAALAEESKAGDRAAEKASSKPRLALCMFPQRPLVEQQSLTHVCSLRAAT